VDQGQEFDGSCSPGNDHFNAVVTCLCRMLFFGHFKRVDQQLEKSLAMLQRNGSRLHDSQMRLRTRNKIWVTWKQMLVQVVETEQLLPLETSRTVSTLSRD
jgi:hypothetical protein